MLRWSSAGRRPCSPKTVTLASAPPPWAARPLDSWASGWGRDAEGSMCVSNPQAQSKGIECTSCPVCTARGRSGDKVSACPGCTEARAAGGLQGLVPRSVQEEPPGSRGVGPQGGQPLTAASVPQPPVRTPSCRDSPHPPALPGTCGPPGPGALLQMRSRPCQWLMEGLVTQAVRGGSRVALGAE